MKIAMSVLYKNHSYYYAFEETEIIRVSSALDADIRILGLQIPFIVSYRATQICVLEEKRSKNYQVSLDSFLVLDDASRLTIFCTKEIPPQKSLSLPDECDIRFGRLEVASNGIRNQVVINLPYISSSHCRLIRSGNKTTLSDTNSKNGIYVNGKEVDNVCLADGDVISVFTTRIVYRNNCLYFENIGNRLRILKIQHLSSKNTVPKNARIPSHSQSSSVPQNDMSDLLDELAGE